MIVLDYFVIIYFACINLSKVFEIYMPKLKTHRGYKKRIKRVTKNGKILRKQAGETHFLEKRSQSRKRRLDAPKTVHSTDAPRVKRSIPYL